MVFISDDSCSVIVTKVPAGEVSSDGYLVEKVGELVSVIFVTADLILDAAWGAVGDDIVYRPVDTVKITACFIVFFLCRQFLLPPGYMVDSEVGAHPSQHPVVFLKVRSARIQDTVVNIMAGCPAHCKERMAFDVIDLTAHEMDNVGADAVNLTAVPFLGGVLV